MAISVIEHDKSLCNNGLLLNIQGRNVIFQFPPHIADDSRRGEWRANDTTMYAGERPYTYAGGEPRTVTLHWHYILDDIEWTGARIHSQLKLLRGYFVNVPSGAAFVGPIQPPAAPGAAGGGAGGVGGGGFLGGLGAGAGVFGGGIFGTVLGGILGAANDIAGSNSPHTPAASATPGAPNNNPGIRRTVYDGLIVKVKLWGVGGNDWMSYRLISVNVKESPTMIGTGMTAFPLRTDISVSMAQWATLSVTGTADTAIQILRDQKFATEDWY